jgi:(1->4)-alpha-D-glucan 1-alpha-D-glucosylmutase
LRLVDPDNRGTIDFEKRRELATILREAYKSQDGQNIEKLLESWQDGIIKMHVLNRALNARNENPDLFLDGEYLPMEVQGQHKDRVVAFARKNGSDWLISISVRCIASVRAPVIEFEKRRDFWNQTALILPVGAPARWTNALADSAAGIASAAGRLNLGEAFERFPLALLRPV